MQFVNKNVKVCWNVFGDVNSRASVPKPAESASPRPDLLDFTADSDVSIVINSVGHAALKK